MSLLLLIITLWFALLLLVVALCLAASRPTGSSQAGAPFPEPLAEAAAAAQEAGLQPQLAPLPQDPTAS